MPLIGQAQLFFSSWRICKGYFFFSLSVYIAASLLGWDSNFYLSWWTTSLRQKFGYLQQFWVVTRAKKGGVSSNGDTHSYDSHCICRIGGEQTVFSGAESAGKLIWVLTLPCFIKKNKNVLPTHKLWCWFTKGKYDVNFAREFSLCNHM